MFWEFQERESKKILGEDQGHKGINLELMIKAKRSGGQPEKKADKRHKGRYF